MYSSLRQALSAMGRQSFSVCMWIAQGVLVFFNLWNAPSYEILYTIINMILNHLIKFRTVELQESPLECVRLQKHYLPDSVIFVKFKKVIQEKLNYFCIALECCIKRIVFQTEIQFLQICVPRYTLMGFVKLEVSGNGKSCGIDTSVLQQLKKRVTSSVPCQTQRTFGSSRGIFWRKKILPTLMSKFFLLIYTKTNRTI